MSESASSQLITCPGGTFTGTVRQYTNGSVATYDPIVYGALTSEFAPALHVYSPTESANPAAHNNLRTQLHLTVTAPAHAAKFNDLPVLAVIHGGGYDSGSRNETSFDGAELAQAGVIVVSIDYRLGIQGFARFHDDAPHHYRGIDDCALALEWIQTHIEDFGGDPTNVTLFGQSAGAGIALWLARRDHYRGMFRRVWAASPSFPRGEMKRRKAALRWALSAPITQSGLEELRRKHLDKGYKRYKRYFPTDLALGPWGYDANELTAIPIIVSSTDRELYQLPAAQQADAASCYTRCARASPGIWGPQPTTFNKNPLNPTFFALSPELRSSTAGSSKRSNAHTATPGTSITPAQTITKPPTAATSVSSFIPETTNHIPHGGYFWPSPAALRRIGLGIAKVPAGWGSVLMGRVPSCLLTPSVGNLSK